jgi:hypothetical protein
MRSHRMIISDPFQADGEDGPPMVRVADVVVRNGTHVQLGAQMQVREPADAPRTYSRILMTTKTDNAFVLTRHAKEPHMGLLLDVDQTRTHRRPMGWLVNLKESQLVVGDRLPILRPDGLIYAQTGGGLMRTPEIDALYLELTDPMSVADARKAQLGTVGVVQKIEQEIALATRKEPLGNDTPR